MDAAAIKAAEEAVKPLLEKLGELGAKGYELALLQNYVKLTQGIACILFWGLLWAIGNHYYKKSVKSEKLRLGDSFDWNQWFNRSGWLFIYSIVPAIVFFFVLFFVGGSVISRAINPHWYALEEIIHLLQSVNPPQ